ncbi:MAG TPA: BON domain-containing protein [Burkholderiales bacterium]|nr:BON domain-containing protein [Burkholderiales bacterium]
MRTSRVVAICALAAVALAACNRGPSDRAANKPNTSPMASTATPKAMGADEAKPKAEEPFKSAVTGKPAPGSAQAADAELSKKVKSALTTATDITAGGLEVASSDGVVTLYGTVDAPVEKDRAALHAMDVDGVRSVVNNLVVVKGS